MVQKRETKTINKLCICEILSLSFVCGAYFLEFRGRNAPEAGKTRMRTAFFTRVHRGRAFNSHFRNKTNFMINLDKVFSPDQREVTI